MKHEDGAHKTQWPSLLTLNQNIWTKIKLSGVRCSGWPADDSLRMLLSALSPWRRGMLDQVSSLLFGHHFFCRVFSCLVINKYRLLNNPKCQQGAILKVYVDNFALLRAHAAMSYLTELEKPESCSWQFCKVGVGHILYLHIGHGWLLHCTQPWLPCAALAGCACFNVPVLSVLACYCGPIITRGLTLTSEGWLAGILISHHQQTQSRPGQRWCQPVYFGLKL